MHTSPTDIIYVDLLKGRGIFHKHLSSLEGFVLNARMWYEGCIDPGHILHRSAQDKEKPEVDVFKQGPNP